MHATEPICLEKNNTPAHTLSVSQKYTQNEVTHLLTAAGKGQLEIVKQLLAQKPTLFHASGDLTDITGQRYIDITVFQYAFRVGDISLCTMLLEQFSPWDKNWLAQQLRSDTFLQTERFTLQSTLEAYRTLQTNWPYWSWEQRDHHWCNVIGKHQQTWPAWLRFDCAELGRNALWCQQRVQAVPRYRDYAPYGWGTDHVWETGDQAAYRLGENFAWRRGKAPGLRMQDMGLEYRCPDFLAHDVQCLEQEELCVRKYRTLLLARL